MALVVGRLVATANAITAGGDGGFDFVAEFDDVRVETSYEIYEILFSGGDAWEGKVVTELLEDERSEEQEIEKGAGRALRFG